jgi:hypothetical protein
MGRIVLPPDTPVATFIGTARRQHPGVGSMSWTITPYHPRPA